MKYSLYASWGCSHPERAGKVSAVFRGEIPFLPTQGFTMIAYDHQEIPPLSIEEVSWDVHANMLIIQAAFVSAEDFLTRLKEVFQEVKIHSHSEGV